MLHRSKNSGGWEGKIYWTFDITFTSLKSPLSTLYPIETPTCQAGQFLRPNGEGGVILSWLLKVSNFQPAVSMILKNLVSKRTWSLIIIGQAHPMPISFSRLNACLTITSDLVEPSLKPPVTLILPPTTEARALKLSIDFQKIDLID